jgi:hypothetical protein
MTELPTHPRARNYRRRDARIPKDERRTAQITFRTTETLRTLAERLARAESRSLANLLERLIRDECRRNLVLTDERAAAAIFKSDTLTATR